MLFTSGAAVLALLSIYALIGTKASLDITVIGFSESRALMPYLLPNRPCSNASALGFKDSVCTNAPQWKEKKDTAFIGKCRNQLPIRSAVCFGQKFAFKWESFASVDKRVDAFLNTTNSNHAQLVVYSVGAHYFAQFDNHSYAFYHHGNLEYRQAWLTQYHQDIHKLMAWLSERKRSGICVIWKTNNIAVGMRPNHPSHYGNAHHWLNRWATAIAETMGLLVFNVEPYTIKESSDIQSSGTNFSDYYHGYNHKLIAEHLLEFAHKNCVTSGFGK